MPAAFRHFLVDGFAAPATVIHMLFQALIP